MLVSTLLFKDYKVNFTHFCQTCYQVYTNHIDSFSGSHSMSNTMKNKFGKFLQELFSRGVACVKSYAPPENSQSRFQVLPQITHQNAQFPRHN